MRTMVRVLAFSTLFLAGCQQPNNVDTADEAVEIANQFWAEKLPQVDLRPVDIKKTDIGTRWRVIYEPPEGSTGGPWVFEVDKKTGRIVNVSGGQ